MIIDKYKPLLSRNLTPAATKKLAMAIASYVDRNGEILLTMNLTSRYSFGDSDRAVLFDACGIRLEDLELDIKDSKGIYSGNRIQSNPFYVCCMMADAYCR